MDALTEWQAPMAVIGLLLGSCLIFVCGRVASGLLVVRSRGDAEFHDTVDGGTRFSGRRRRPSPNERQVRRQQDADEAALRKGQGARHQQGVPILLHRMVPLNVLASSSSGLHQPKCREERIFLGQLDKRGVDELQSAHALHQEVRRLLMEYMEDSEDLVDAPQCSNSVTIEWIDRNGKPHAMGASKLRELKSLIHSGMLRSIRVRLAQL